MIKRNYLIGTALLLAGAGVTMLVDYSQKRSSGASEALKLGLLGGVDLSKITAIDLSKEGKALSLSRDNEGRWTIAGPEAFPVSAEKVVKFLEDIAKTKVVDQVASTQDKWSSLELEKGSELSLKGEKESLIFKLVLGKLRTNGGQYARIGDKPESYLLSNPPTIEWEAKDWELKKLVDLKKEDIKEIVFTPSSAKKPAIFSRAKAEDKFALKDSPGADKEKTADIEGLETLLSGISYQARSPIDESTSKALLLGDKVEASLFNGTKYSIQTADIGADKAKKHYVLITVSGEGPSKAKQSALLGELMGRHLFEIDESLRTRLSRGLEDFVKTDAESKGH